MRSAIYYPDIDVRSEATMRSALLMWDELKVIVPYKDYKPEPATEALAQAWEVIGSTMCPDVEQKRQAHTNIEAMLGAEIPVDAYFRGDADGEIYEIWPQKLLPETFALLNKRQIAGPLLANGDYPFDEKAGLAVMAKLADACAGTTFARWTDRFLAYGFVADRNPAAAAQTAVVPLTLSLINTAEIPLQTLIDFRKREKIEARGSDYTKMRHKYADAVSAHIEQTKTIASENQLTQLRKEFRDQMERDLKDLREALSYNFTDAITSGVVVSVTVGVGSWLAAHDPQAAIAAAAAGGGVGTAIQKVMELFRTQRGFSKKQREIMATHPMAYLYALNRVR